MLEIERKILGINESEVVRRILKLKPKPKKIFDGLVRVKYFDFADGRIRKRKDLLRLREISPRRGEPFTELVYKIYKGVKHGCKYFEELELKVPGPKIFSTYEKFLLALGFKQTLYYEKKRTLFTHGKIAFEIDKHPKIPAFLEIEAPSPAAIKKITKQLGLEKNEQTAESIGELMRRRYPKLKLNGLKF